MSVTNPKPRKAVLEALADRRTAKTLGDPNAPAEPQGLSRAAVNRLIEAAGMAPFHHAAHPDARGDGPKEPWRAHMLDGRGCRRFLTKLDAEDHPGKIADMLAAAEALICVTWLPDPPPEGAEAPVLDDRNSEHIAATGAFIQNILTTASSAGIPSYWSSGGVLRTRKYLKKLRAGPHEQLLGAVFLFPADSSGFEIKPGALREERAAYADWAAWRRM